MTAPTVYKSTDGSAPVLNGLSGSLAEVLYRCLVTGYGAKLAAGWTSAFVGQDVALNSMPTWRILQPGAGLMKPYLRIQDDAPNTNFAGGREARLWGVERDVSGFGDNPLAAKYPTAVQAASGVIVRKSGSYSSTSVPWIVIADDRTVYFFAKVSDFVGYSGFCFGEIYSLKANDNFNSIIIGRVTEQIAATTMAAGTQETLDLLAGLTVAAAGHFMPRSWSESYSSAVAVGKHGHAGHSAATLVGLLPYPHLTDQGIYLSQVTVHEPGTPTILRGRMRGFWHLLHPVGIALNDGDTWSGAGALAGKTFLAIKPTAQGTGIFVMETSNTWETN